VRHFFRLSVLAIVEGVQKSKRGIARCDGRGWKVGQRGRRERHVRAQNESDGMRSLTHWRRQREGTCTDTERK